MMTYIYILIALSIFVFLVAMIFFQQKELEVLIHAESDAEGVAADLVERNKDLEQIAFMVSHNLRAPVANVIALSDEIGSTDLTDVERKEMLNGLARTVKKLDNVVMDLSAVVQTKTEVTEELEKVDLLELIAEIKQQHKQVIKRENVTIETDFSAVKEISTVRTYIYSIFNNLISNGIKYRRQGMNPKIRITSAKTKDAILLTFKDNGLGIDLSENKEQVFGLYRRFHSHIEGKGAGLFMTKAQVEALDGSISISSKINEGTLITIVLPVE